MWQQAERVQKSPSGDFRAMIGGEWTPVGKAQKNANGEYRVFIDDAEPIEPSGEISPLIERNLLEQGVDNLLPAITKAGEIYDATADAIPHPLAMNTEQLGDFATGASSLMRGGGNLISEGLGDDIFPKNSRGSGFETLGKVVDPVSLAIGGGVAKALPYAPVLGEAGGGLLAFGKNLLSGGTAGAGIAALSEDIDLAEGAGLGAALNSTLPGALGLAGKAAQGAKTMFTAHPIKTAVRAAGDKFDDVVAALQNTKSKVPGTKLNAGQASTGSGSTEFAALQKLVDQRSPTPANALKSTQEGSRKAVVEAISGTKDDLSSAIGQRKANTDPLFQAAREGADADITSVISNIDDVLAKSPANRELATELTAIKRLLTNDGKALTNPEQISSILPTIKAALKNPENSFIQKNLIQVQDDIVNAIPKLKEARTSFANESAPINRMQVARELTNKLQGGGKETPSTFIRALDDTTEDAASRIIKKSTGFPRGNLDEIMTPEQMSGLKGVEADLLRNIENKSMASAGAGNMLERIGAAEIKPTGMFSPILSVSRGFFNRQSQKMTEKGIKELSELMQDPQALAIAMKKLAPKDAIIMQKTLQELGQKAVAPLVSSQGGQ